MGCMHKDPCDARMWTKKTVIEAYSDMRSLQIPEAIIFIKYKDEILNQDILDIGCGGGRTSYVLKKMARLYRGVDYSESMISICKQKFGPDGFFLADVRDLSMFANSSFDFIIFSFNGIDCLSHEDRLKAFKEIHRVLKPGKLLVFSSHNRGFPYMEILPKLRICVNPITMLKNIYYFFISVYNFNKNKTKEIMVSEYAILRSHDHNFAYLYYFIDAQQQAAQLESLGFKKLDAYDLDGNELGDNRREAHSPWIYYVARKNH
jgi:SAM-dependent methyltransferase